MLVPNPWRTPLSVCVSACIICRVQPDRELKGGVDLGQYTSKRAMGGGWDQWRQHVAQSGCQRVRQHTFSCASVSRPAAQHAVRQKMCVLFQYINIRHWQSICVTASSK